MATGVREVSMQARWPATWYIWAFDYVSEWAQSLYLRGVSKLVREIKIEWSTWNSSKILTLRDLHDFLGAIILFVCEIYITWEVYKFWKMLRNIDTEALRNAIEHLRGERNVYY